MEFVTHRSSTIMARSKDKIVAFKRIKNYAMKTIKNQLGGCPKRGCRVSVILPFCFGPVHVYTAMHGKRNDTKAILSISNLLLDKVAIKKAA